MNKKKKKEVKYVHCKTWPYAIVLHSLTFSFASKVTENSFDADPVFYFRSILWTIFFRSILWTILADPTILRCQWKKIKNKLNQQINDRKWYHTYNHRTNTQNKT